MGPLESGDPDRVGRYRLVARLGAGGMGQVYLGRSQAGRTVAVKRIHPHLAGDASFRERFAREVTAARQVSGAFTAPVIDADPEGAVPWLVTAYVPSAPLDTAIDGTGPLPGASLRFLAAGLAEALMEIHRVGLIHRDLKPGNVLLAEDGPRVIDFGIARAADTQTATQSVIGTPGFMSPEQIQGDHLTAASDMFAFGAILAYAASGTGPFGTGSVPTLMMRIINDRPDLSAVPHDLVPLVSACMAKDPAARPGPQQVLDVLGDAEPGASWLPPAFVSAIHASVGEVQKLLGHAPQPGPDAATAMFNEAPPTAAQGYGSTRVFPEPGQAGATAGHPATRRQTGGLSPEELRREELRREELRLEQLRREDELRRAELRREEDRRRELARREDERREAMRRQEQQREEQRRAHERREEQLRRDEMRREQQRARAQASRPHGLAAWMVFLVLPILQWPVGWFSQWTLSSMFDQDAPPEISLDNLSFDLFGELLPLLGLGYFVLNNLVGLYYLARSIYSQYLFGIVGSSLVLVVTNIVLYNVGFFE
ncbi:serine/threonine-protein kinase [Allonocardiopsis opalescens]|uniref:Serine/threonine protein kinase n=1 Tax=Allonocardiopsis opalescens TaxID=1144618 RepID=A0A2T0PWW5_9ACTN|nr:serine/threonine-protein kinase [Allonocardiopsis opalescens]PRX96037.1 serine/threonine protein kinase [Allonocardiopsis opalescens]